MPFCGEGAVLTVAVGDVGVTAGAAAVGTAGGGDRSAAAGADSLPPAANGPGCGSGVPTKGLYVRIRGAQLLSACGTIQMPRLHGCDPLCNHSGSTAQPQF